MVKVLYKSQDHTMKLLWVDGIPVIHERYHSGSRERSVFHIDVEPIAVTLTNNVASKMCKEFPSYLAVKAHVQKQRWTTKQIEMFAISREKHEGQQRVKEELHNIHAKDTTQKGRPAKEERELETYSLQAQA